MKRINGLDLIDIYEVIKKEKYECKDIELYLVIKEEDNEFKVSLNGISANKDFELEIRIAIEQHSNGNHDFPHFQTDLTNIDSDFFKSGSLHINLLVNDVKEMQDCCKGFVFKLVEILNFLEQIINCPEGTLLQHFFSSKVLEFEKYVSIWYDLIELAFIKDKVFLETEGLFLIEVKHKKSNDLCSINHNRKVFYLIRLINTIQILKPLLEIPLYNRLNTIPLIKKLGLKNEEHIKNIDLLLKHNCKIEKLIPEKYILEISKL